MELFREIVSVCGGVTTISVMIIAIVRPIREKVFGTKAIQDGMKCQLRADMLHTYYKRKDEKKIRQYEAENFEYEYSAYKSLKGNSFIDSIKREVEKWEVVS